MPVWFLWGLAVGAGSGFVLGTNTRNIALVAAGVATFMVLRNRT